MDERQRYREVFAINRAIAGAEDQEELLRLVVERTAAFTGASACLLLLVQADGLARVVRSTGLDPGLVSGLALPLDERSVEELARRLAIPDTDGFTGVPVAGREGLIGVLAVYLPAARHGEGTVDIELLSALADQAVIALDAAERARTLRASERRFRAMADGAPVLIWMSGLDKGCTWFNRPWLEFTGRGMAQELGGGWAEGVHPDDLARCLGVYTGHFDRREPFTMEYRLRRHDGQYRWLLDSGRPLLDGTGTFTGYIGSCVDVTERRLSEEALRRSEARFRALAEESPVGIFETDTLGNNTYLNRVGAELLGVPVARARGRGWIRSIHPEDRERLFRDWSAAVGSGQVFSGEYRLLRPGGDPVTIRGYASAIGDACGGYSGYVGVMLDVTALRSMEQQLATASRLAAMGTLVAGVAHEINNPLSVVMGNQAVALERLESLLAGLRQGAALVPGPVSRALEEMKEELRESEAGAERIRRIVKDLSTIGKPNAPRTRIRLAEIVAGAIRWLPVDLRHLAEIRVEDLGAPDILAAGGQVEQVLVNLLTNAIKASPVGKPGKPAPVTIRIGPGPGGRARLEVADQGAGIEPALLDRIFEPFFTTRQVGQGTGLGLSVCHAIVTAYGGSIAVESELGKGTTFRVELPPAEPEDPTDGGDPPTFATPGPGR